ncbi:MAG TPA: RnfABCDGE type electron transport complex subunit D [Stellaceae bacterium]|nr:RnfABCDGE type electron transport complex subunit D [Stellaceae bacterium]
MPAISWPKDGRYYQIAALGLLLGLNMTLIDLGAKPLPSLFAVAGALGTQAVCSRLWRLPTIDLRSPLITGLSLSLLLRADEPWLHAAAGCIAIASKFVLRIDGKHVWNPAGFALVALIFGTDDVWISPGQWGASLWFAALLGFLALLVLQRARRADIALFFLASYAALLFARAFWLGDPLAIPLHQLESGSLLLFAFFMISDPKTTPEARFPRFLFAFAVALLAHYLAFFMQMRPALYVALIALSPVNPILDRVFPSQRFQWSATPRQGASP